MTITVSASTARGTHSQSGSLKLEVASNKDEQNALQTVTAYFAAIDLRVTAPTGTEAPRPGYRSLLQAAVTTRPVPLSAGLGSTAKFQACAQAVGAAQSEKKCLDRTVDLTKPDHAEFPLEISADQEGAIEVDWEESIVYTVHGKEHTQGQPHPSAAPSGAKATKGDKVKSTLSTGWAIFLAAGGTTLIAAIAALIARRYRAKKAGASKAHKKAAKKANKSGA